MKAVRENVDEVCPKIQNTKKKEPWEDEQLQEMTKELRRTNDGEEIRRKQKLIRARRKILKNNYYKELADNINTAAEAREVEKEFALAKKHSAFKKGNPKAVSNEKLKSHFEDHFKARALPLPPEIEYPEEHQQLYQDQKFHIDESPPDDTEVISARKSFKNGKSWGTDKVKTEGLKYNQSCNLTSAIVALLTLIWTTLTVPSSWLPRV